eukprot:11310497-Alexandrium_andersonii.AAC.1
MAWLFIASRPEGGGAPCTDGDAAPPYRATSCRRGACALPWVAAVMRARCGCAAPRKCTTGT